MTSDPTSYAGVVPNMSHCQVTRSMRFAQQVGIIKPNPNPTSNPNPNRRNNEYLHTRLCEIAHELCSGCELFGTVSYLILQRHIWPVRNCTVHAHCNVHSAFYQRTHGEYEFQHVVENNKVRDKIPANGSWTWVHRAATYRMNLKL